MTDFDITIIGGGLVGTTLAIKLKNAGFKICLVEAFVPPDHPQAIADMRSIALNYQSREIFKKLGVWDEIENFSTPIKKIHVSEKGSFGHALLDSEESVVDSFGAVMPIIYLYNLLQKKLSECSNVELLCPAKLTSLSQHPDHWALDINQKKVTTKFLIAADGDKSFIREFLKLPTEKTDFHQTAIVSTLLASKNHNNTAYERFTELGVLALLPLQNNRVACIWTCDNNNLEKIKHNFVDITQEYIGHRLGKLSQPGNIQTYPIYELIAQIQTLPRFILLGNSAHVLHPVAAQGFNLSLRDADGLADILLKAQDLSDANIQENYLNLRQKDQNNTTKMTNTIVKIFKPQTFPLPYLRGTGLFVFNLITPLKTKLCEKSMGI